MNFPILCGYLTLDIKQIRDKLSIPYGFKYQLNKKLLNHQISTSLHPAITFYNYRSVFDTLFIPIKSIYVAVAGCWVEEDLPNRQYNWFQILTGSQSEWSWWLPETTNTRILKKKAIYPMTYFFIFFIWYWFGRLCLERLNWLFRSSTTMPEKKCRITACAAGCPSCGKLFILPWV